MIYAINKLTKEHRVVGNDPIRISPKFNIVAATPDGWIDWCGGECPLPDGALCEIRCESGASGEVKAGSMVWSRIGGIIAYRPILYAKADPPAWDGEGLPPVGCECEYRNNDCCEWCRAKVVGYDGPACVVAVDGEGYFGEKDADKFRPIRSEEDMAAEIEMNEASKMLRDAHLQGMRRDNEYDTFRALYRAGYRRT